MATILVDYENVHGSNGLKGVEVLTERDTLIIFFSEACRKIKREYMQAIIDSHCDFRIVKLKKTGKNALDFYIAVECGVLFEKGEKELAIISNDKGFQAVIDYFKVNTDMSDIHIVKAASLEKAVMALDTPANKDRIEVLLNKTCMLDIVEEYARVEERKMMKKKISDVMRGTEYEDKLPEIINLVENKKGKGNKLLYTSSLHSFGKSSGTEIYRLVKKVV